ncbi:MAG TPA: hypothetical protein GXX18_04800 [Bacillales bacterium]|nr:hypothetical protein [Bacillales bacterium]
MEKSALKSFMVGLIAAMVIPITTYATEEAQINEEQIGEAQTNEEQTDVSPFGAGEWDFLGSENIRLGDDTVVIDDSKYWSGGGDYKIRISGANSINVITIWVSEEDPTSSIPVYGRTLNGNANGEYEFSTRDVVDGSNNKAELKFEFTGALQPYDDIVVEFYD